MILTLTTSNDSSPPFSTQLGLPPGEVTLRTTPWGELYLLPEVSPGPQGVTLLLDIASSAILPATPDHYGPRLPAFHHVHDRAYQTGIHFCQALRTLLPIAPGPIDEIHVDFPGFLDSEVEAMRPVFEPAGWKVEPRKRRITRRTDLATALHEVSALLIYLDAELFAWIAPADWQPYWQDIAPYLQELPHSEFLQEILQRNASHLYDSKVQRLYAGSDRDQELQLAIAARQRSEEAAHHQTIAAVAELLGNHAAAKVLDLGCGTGALEVELVQEERIEQVMGMDLSLLQLHRTNQTLQNAGTTPAQAQKLALTTGNATWKDHRFLGFDAVVALDIINQLAPWAQRDFSHNLFDFLAPPLVIVSTVLREEGKPGPGERFAWRPGEFTKWTRKMTRQYPYTVEVHFPNSTHPIAVFQRISSL